MINLHDEAENQKWLDEFAEIEARINSGEIRAWKINELTQDRAQVWSQKVCWSIGEAIWLLKGIEPVGTQSAGDCIPKFNAKGDDVDNLVRATFTELLKPNGKAENGESVYSPAEIIRVAEKIHFGQWPIWKALMTDTSSSDEGNELRAFVASGRTPQRALQQSDGTTKSLSGDDWKVKAKEAAQRIGLVKWEAGIRQITARNICEEVADELSKDEDTHGMQGQRSPNNVRTEGLRGWKFCPPEEVKKVD